VDGGSVAGGIYYVVLIKFCGTEAVWQEDILCGLQLCGRDQNIKLCGTEAVWQDEYVLWSSAV
jgi:hypothetical protein